MVSSAYTYGYHNIFSVDFTLRKGNHTTGNTFVALIAALRPYNAGLRYKSARILAQHEQFFLVYKAKRPVWG